MNAWNDYGTFWIESEAVLGIADGNLGYAHQVIDQMTIDERRKFRRELLTAYWFVGEGLGKLSDVQEMLGELEMIANDTAPDS